MSLVYGPPPQEPKDPKRPPADPLEMASAPGASVTEKAGAESAPEQLPEHERRPLRSRTFFGTRGTPAGFTARAFTKSMGFTQEDLAKPVIGICQT